MGIRHWGSYLLAFLFLASATLGPSLALAGKPIGSVSPAPGAIYFYSSGGAMRLNGDGGEKVASNPGVPCYRLHGGKRWFMVRDYGSQTDLDG